MKISSRIFGLLGFNNMAYGLFVKIADTANNWQTLKLFYYKLEKLIKHELEEIFTVYLRISEISFMETWNNKLIIFKFYWLMN